MTQQERLDFLLEKLKEDSVQYKNLQVEENETAKKEAVRSLMNIRMPRYIDRKILKVQDDFLKNQTLEKGIVTLDMIPTVKEQYASDSPLANKISIWQGDITRLKVDVIVNAANSALLGCFVPCHRCIDNAIHSGAGMELREECNKIMNQRKIKYGPNYEEPTGTATITEAYNLPCKKVIHTVGPICYFGLNDELCNDLKNCYESVLNCCMKNGLKTVAFCCISTGEFHFPNEKAAEIAVQAVGNYKSQTQSKIKVVFNVFKDVDYEIYRKLFG